MESVIPNALLGSIRSPEARSRYGLNGRQGCREILKDARDEKNKGRSELRQATNARMIGSGSYTSSIRARRSIFGMSDPGICSRQVTLDGRGAVDIHQLRSMRKQDAGETEMPRRRLESVIRSRAGKATRKEGQ